MKQLPIIIDYLEKYPLITKKRNIFEGFKQAFYIIKNKGFGYKIKLFT